MPTDPLLAWFDAHARVLPWRSPDRTPWGVLVSEVMLQQTPVARVEPAWRAWMAHWPTPADLASAPRADALRTWGRLGYPRRALWLHECAVAIVARHGGQVPDDEAALRALPGVGAYTAAAVRAFAFGHRAMVLDTNVRRVLTRLYAGAALPAPTQTARDVALVERLMPPDDATAARWALATMELGALVCTARTPSCQECPLASSCAWLAAWKPPDEHASRRRAQPWVGTDRQVRGRVMALLREGIGPIPAGLVAAAWPDSRQLTRCVAALAADGLLVPLAASGDQAGPDDEPVAYRLP